MASHRTYRGEDPLQASMFDAAKGERFREAARDWVRRNHGTWLWMCRRAARYAAERKAFSIAALVEEARWTRPVEGVDDYAVNNNIRAPLTRMLVEAVPQCGPYVKTRDSVVDL